MSLDDIILKGKSRKPPRVILYGEDKVGKSTFCAQFPKSIFLDAEGGLSNIDTASINVQGGQFSHIMQVLDMLINETHQYKTLVIDSLDWVEQKMIWPDVCKAQKVSNIEEIGYARGYTFALNYWHQLVQKLDALRDQGMTILCIAHAQIQRVEDPMQIPYDKWTLKLHKKANALLCEWTDCILFACYENFVREIGQDFNKKITRAYSSGNRVIYTEGQPSFEAGNRFGLPEKLPLNYADFELALNETLK